MNARRFGILKNVNGNPKLIHNYLINNYGFTLVSFDTLKNNKGKDMLLAEMDDFIDEKDQFFEGCKFTDAGIFRVLVPTWYVSTGCSHGNVVYIRDHIQNITRTFNDVDRLMNKWDIWSKYHV